MRRKVNIMKLNIPHQIHRNFKQVRSSLKLLIKRIFSSENTSRIGNDGNLIEAIILKEKILKNDILKSRRRKTKSFYMKRFLNKISVIALLISFSTVFYGGINSLKTFASSDIDISYPNTYQPYSMTNPSGKPNFTAAQIDAQKISGANIRNQIIAAASNPLISQFTIPAGNYGFAQTVFKNATTNGFILDGLKRPANNPFTIKAQGVTFWFDIMNSPAPNWGRAVYFNDCENIILEGLTIDTYVRNAIEGSLSVIDIPNNRIEITLLDGTFNDEAKILAYPATFGNPGSQSRLIPIKPDGNLIAPLYNINNSWGPEHLFINNITKSATNKYWLTMRSNALLNTIFTTDWLSAYGNEGTLEIGDGICLLYGVMGGVVIDNSKQITIKDTNCYIAKGSIFEGGGYGNHKWINVHFSPRPGTNQILGGGENMSEGLRVGSTYDNCYFGLTSDDAINMHGFWGIAKSFYNPNTVIFDRVPSSVVVGDVIEFYNNKNGALAYTYTISGIAGSTETDINGNRNNVNVTFTQTPDASIVNQNADLWARYTSAECAGWVVRNCVFESNYQRILLQSGPGLFENNIVNSMGSGLHLYGNFYSYEGGFLNNITIQNNVFLNSSLSPNTAPITLEFSNMTTQTQWPTGINIIDNLFVNAGAEAIRLKNAKNILIEGNIVTNPLVFTALSMPAAPRATKVFTGDNVSNVTIRDNYLYEKTPYTDENRFYNGAATLSNNIAVTEFGDTTTLGARDAYLSQKTAQQIISAVTPPSETTTDSSNLNNLSVVGSPFTENFTKDILHDLWSYDMSHFSVIQNYQSISGKSIKQSFINSTFGGIYAFDTKNKLTAGGTYTLTASYKVLTDIMPTNFYFGFTRDGGLNQKNTQVNFTGNVKNTVYTFKREFTLENFDGYYLHWFNLTGTDGSVIVIDSLILEKLAAPTPIITFTTLSVSQENVVSGFAKNTSTVDFLAGISTRSGVNVKFYYMDTLELTPGDLVGTNTTFKVFLDSDVPLYTYTALLEGDIDEDGGITVSDLAMIKSHILKATNLEGINLQAADMNSSSSVSISDLLAVKKEIVLN